MEEINYDIMRYELDENDYVLSVFFGCSSGYCTGYEGEIPSGYSTIEEWALNANIRAYKMIEGNLVFDEARNKELEELYAKEAKDNSCVRFKDLYDLENKIDDVIDLASGQYEILTTEGNVIDVDRVKSSFPKIKITQIKDSYIQRLRFVISQKNLLRNDAVDEDINGVSFMQNDDRSITIYGTATDDIEYNILGTKTSFIQNLVLTKNVDYYLSCGNFTIRMYNYTGTDRELVYEGTSGVINFDTDRVVTNVVIAIDKDTEIEWVTIYPQIELGTVATEYEKYKQATYNVDLSEFVRVVPSDDLTPSTNLVPNGYLIDYITIEKGKMVIYAEGKEFEYYTEVISLFNDKNIIHVVEDVYMEMEYCTKDLVLEDLGFLQGLATTTNKFKIREDGSIEAHDGYFSGDIHLSNGGKVIGGDGLLSSLIINGNVNSLTFGGNAQMVPMGYSLKNNNNSYIETTKDYIMFEFNIPNTFTVTKANILLKHIPTEYKYLDVTEYTGNSRNLKLYKNNNYRNTKFVFDYGYMRVENNSDYFDEIYNAFGEDGFTGLATEYSEIESVDIKEEISKGFNCFKIQTGNDLVESIADMYGQTGACMATLIIYGYMSYEEEKEV